MRTPLLLAPFAALMVASCPAAEPAPQQVVRIDIGARSNDPEQIEREITTPLERELIRRKDVQRSRSTSTHRRVVVELEFDAPPTAQQLEAIQTLLAAMRWPGEAPLQWRVELAKASPNL